MASKTIPVHMFVLVVVRSDDRFVLVQERKFGRTWFLPAGRVEPGETLCGAARRETREEAGIAVELDGLLGIQHYPAGDAPACFRFVFAARPADDAPLKREADRHSIQARWVRWTDLAAYPLRHDEVRRWFARVAGGGEIVPLGLLEEMDLP